MQETTHLSSRRARVVSALIVSCLAAMASACGILGNAGRSTGARSAVPPVEKPAVQKSVHERMPEGPRPEPEPPRRSLKEGLAAGATGLLLAGLTAEDEFILLTGTPAMGYVVCAVRSADEIGTARPGLSPAHRRGVAALLHGCRPDGLTLDPWQPVFRIQRREPQARVP